MGGKSYEYMNLKKECFNDRGATPGSDVGRKGFTNKDEDLHKSKFPNLRNVELSWPYMHDGLVRPGCPEALPGETWILSK